VNRIGNGLTRGSGSCLGTVAFFEERGYTISIYKKCVYLPLELSSRQGIF